MKLGSKEFIALQKEWYDKLAEDGFEDAERFTKKMQPKATLKQESRTMAGYHNSHHANVSTEQFFIDCRQHSFTKSFEDEESLLIWNAYADGESIKQISKSLELPFGRVRKLVNYHIDTFILTKYRKGAIVTHIRDNNETEK